MKKSLIASLTTLALLAGCGGITIHTGNKEVRNRPEEIAAIKTQLAIEYMNSHDYRAAVSAIEEALQVQPRNENAWLVRAEIYQYLKVPEKAEESFQRALSIKPDSAEINNNYGWFLCNSGGRPNQALTYFDRALADPTYPSPQVAYMNKGICSARLGQYNLAMAYLERSQAADPSFAPAQKEMARVRMMEGNLGEADRQFCWAGKLPAPAAKPRLPMNTKRSCAPTIRIRPNFKKLPQEDPNDRDLNPPTGCC